MFFYIINEQEISKLLKWLSLLRIQECMNMHEYANERMLAGLTAISTSLFPFYCTIYTLESSQIMCSEQTEEV